MPRAMSIPCCFPMAMIDRRMQIVTHSFKDIVFSRDRSVQDVLKTEEMSRVEGFKKQLMTLAEAELPAMTPRCHGKQSGFQVWRFYFPAMPYLQLSRHLLKPQSLGTSKSCDAAVERFKKLYCL